MCFFAIILDVSPESFIVADYLFDGYNGRKNTVLILIVIIR